MTSPVLIVRCDDCGCDLVAVRTDGGVTVKDDVSGILITGVADWPTMWPEFGCPKHGEREPFDLVEYYTELCRIEATFAVTV